MMVIDFYALVLQSVSPRRRKAKWVAYLRSLIHPIKQLFEDASVLPFVRKPLCTDVAVSFVAYRAYALNRAGLSGQTMAVEKLLNMWFFNAFDSTALQGDIGYEIYITDSTPPLVDYVLYQRPENIGVRTNLSSEGITGMPPMYTREEVLQPFSTINIPSSLTASATDTVVKAILSQYVPAGYRFTINYY